MPPIHVLIAAHEQDRKETEDLLAGFDKPGRSPKRPTGGARDFVDYYENRGVEAPSPPPPSVTSPPSRQRDANTLIVKRGKQPLPAWVPWAGAAAFMVAIGGGVAFLAMATDPAAKRPVPTAAASATAKVTASTPSARDDIPAPPPPQPTEAASAALTATVITASPPPRPSARPPKTKETKEPASPTPAPTTDPRTPPRDDFLRDL